MDGFQKMKLFTGNANPKLAQDIAACLDIPLTETKVTRFSDDEIQVKIEESVRGTDAFVIQPTCCPVNDNVMELLIILDTLRRASARRITAVIPYYGYARQDKKIKPREPITAKLVANLISTAGADRVLTVDLHARQIMGFFDKPVDHLSAGPLLAEHFIQCGLQDANIVVVSPDVGGVSRARAMAEALDSGIAIITKRRPEPNKCEVMEIIGNVQDKICIMVDDMIDTGGSIVSGANALKERGAQQIYACCTHPVLSRDAVTRITNSPIERLVVTDTIPMLESKLTSKVTVLSVASLIAQALRRIHEDQSVSALCKDFG